MVVVVVVAAAVAVVAAGVVIVSCGVTLLVDVRVHVLGRRAAGLLGLNFRSFGVK